MKRTLLVVFSLITSFSAHPWQSRVSLLGKVEMIQFQEPRFANHETQKVRDELYSNKIDLKVSHRSFDLVDWFYRISFGNYHNFILSDEKHAHDHKLIHHEIWANYDYLWERLHLVIGFFGRYNHKHSFLEASYANQEHKIDKKSDYRLLAPWISIPWSESHQTYIVNPHLYFYSQRQNHPSYRSERSWEQQCWHMYHVLKTDSPSTLIRLGFFHYELLYEDYFLDHDLKGLELSFFNPWRWGISSFLGISHGVRTFHESLPQSDELGNVSSIARTDNWTTFYGSLRWKFGGRFRIYFRGSYMAIHNKNLEDYRRSIGILELGLQGFLQKSHAKHTLHELVKHLIFKNPFGFKVGSI